MTLDLRAFPVTVEVVPPAGPSPESLLAALAPLGELPVAAFSVATNPVARPRMSALALCALIQRRVGRPAILHCTTRDQNRLGLQAQLWGAAALGVETVLVSRGDAVALEARGTTSAVRDLDVLALVSMAREAGLQVGVVLDPAEGGWARAVEALMAKGEAGAQFGVTQPVYDEATAEALAERLTGTSIPVLLGVLPLRTARHADFLHRRVAGIEVPAALRERMRRAEDEAAAGHANAREVLAWARRRFDGACLMPPFGHYEMVGELLAEERSPA
jgi:homocysteine S-methyltransferase